MCATRHSANAVTTSGPDKQASWLFDLQDHQLIQLVNSFVAARNMSMSLAQPEEGLHPRGIIKLTTDPGMRIARAVIILLESLEARGPQERLQALRRLHDEVLYSALSSLQKNTARVLIQIMKDLVPRRAARPYPAAAGPRFLPGGARHAPRHPLAAAPLSSAGDARSLEPAGLRPPRP